VAANLGANLAMTAMLSPAARAFDAIAPEFDEIFSAWLSVAAQRRAVRAALLREFTPGSKIIEIGGGTGEDAAFLAERGYHVLLTDSSPAMVSIARGKLLPLKSYAEVAAAEDLENFASRHVASGWGPFEGAFSNFAPLNCVENLVPTARGLARLLRPGAAAMLVLFGTTCPGEMLVELLRRRPKNSFRRLKKSPVNARLAQRDFTVTYHRMNEMRDAFAPWFRLEKRIGIGITVPPSAAEPWISQRPRLLAALERLDSRVCRPLAIFGDHVLYQFRRTDAPV
jgi:SAM-dependent methyltransferase